MELEEWLRLYQAISEAAGDKARTYWMIAAGFLLASCLLAFPIAFVSFSYTGGEGRYFLTVLAGIGALLSLIWSLIQSRAWHELAHFEALLRSIEGQFAGTELYRGLAKLIAGEEAILPGSAWRGKEWQTEAIRFRKHARLSYHCLISLLPVVFAGAWIALAVSVWI